MNYKPVYKIITAKRKWGILDNEWPELSQLTMKRMSDISWMSKRKDIK